MNEYVNGMECQVIGCKNKAMLTVKQKGITAHICGECLNDHKRVYKISKD